MDFVFEGDDDDDEEEAAAAEEAIGSKFSNPWFWKYRSSAELAFSSNRRNSTLSFLLGVWRSNEDSDGIEDEEEDEEEGEEGEEEEGEEDFDDVPKK